MTPNFVVVVNVLLPICCQIISGMPHLHIFFGEEIVTLLFAMTDNVCEILSMVGIRK